MHHGYTPYIHPCRHFSCVAVTLCEEIKKREKTAIPVDFRVCVRGHIVCVCHNKTCARDQCRFQKREFSAIPGVSIPFHDQSMTGPPSWDPRGICVWDLERCRHHDHDHITCGFVYVVGWMTNWF